MTGIAARMLPDGKRLHLQHGPIDLVIGADGKGAAVERAFTAATKRFETVLAELVDELALLRSACPPEGLGLQGPVARRMEAAVRIHGGLIFITPMAAVAGSVADEILEVMLQVAPLTRAYVNNGGDIALHLAEGERFSIRIAGLAGEDHGRVDLMSGGGIGGIATSGRGGRSLTMGIADSVTILAASAAEADAAATVVANAVDLPGHPAIFRSKASEVAPDSDLGDRLVTTACGHLAPREIDAALDRGLAEARRLLDAGAIAGAALFLKGHSRIAGSGLSLVSPPATTRLAVHA